MCTLLVPRAGIACVTLLSHCCRLCHLIPWTDLSDLTNCPSSCECHCCLHRRPIFTLPLLPSSPLQTAIFFAIFFTVYLIAHWRNWLPKIFASRKFLYPKRTLPYETPPHRRHLFSWLVDSWSVGDKDVLRYYGLDALLFLRSLRLQSLVILLCSLYGLCVILPVNMMGEAVFTSPPWGATYTTAHIGPLASVAPSSPADPDDPSPPPTPPPAPPSSGSTPEDATRLFLAHVVGAYYMTGVCLYLLWRQVRGEQRQEGRKGRSEEGRGDRINRGIYAACR